MKRVLFLLLITIGVLFPLKVSAQTCGTQGAACCQNGGSPYCLQNSGLVCQLSDFTCQLQSNCGTAGLACCPGEFPCGGLGTNLQCVNNICELCGGANMACCTGAGQAPCGVGFPILSCQAGICKPNVNCGQVVGAPCCTGFADACNPLLGLTCNGTTNKCVQCGQLNSAPCVPGGCAPGLIRTIYEGRQLCVSAAENPNCRWAPLAFGQTDCGGGEEACNWGDGTPSGVCCPAGQCITLPNNIDNASGTLVDPTCDGGDGIRTGLGCLNITGIPTIEILLNWATGIAGGIAFLMIVLAGFQITTAAGDAKKVKAGQELLISALSGLFLVALAVVLLNFIGVNVLGLQQFGFAPN